VTNHEIMKFQSLSRTQIMKVATQITLPTFMICVRDKSATLSGTCRGLCRKVGVMEFELTEQLARAVPN